MATIFQKSSKFQLDTLREKLEKRAQGGGVFRLDMTKEQAAQMLAVAMAVCVGRRGGRYLQTPYDRVAVEAVADVMTGGLTARKFSLALVGQCGNGKTTLTEALRLMISELSACGMFDDITETGGASLPIVSAMDLWKMAQADQKKFEAIKQSPLLAIDDMGIEPATAKDYGNLLMPIVELLEYRYREALFTVVTTNLELPDVVSKYGGRIGDRFREMFNVVKMTGPSLRG